MSWAEGRKDERGGMVPGEGDASQGDASALPGDTQPAWSEQLTAALSSLVSKGFLALSPWNRGGCTSGVRALPWSRCSARLQQAKATGTSRNHAKSREKRNSSWLGNASSPGRRILRGLHVALALSKTAAPKLPSPNSPVGLLASIREGKVRRQR